MLTKHRRLCNNHHSSIDTKLHRLILSCRESNNARRQNCSHKPEPRVQVSGQKVLDLGEPRLQQLLLPSNVAFLQKELQFAQDYTAILSCGNAQYPRNGQLLDVNLLRWMLEELPSHPPGIMPRLVSYQADMIIAARKGDVVEMCRILANRPKSQYCFTIANLTPMFFAIESGSLSAVRCLLDRGVRINDAFGRSRTTPLAAALQFRHLHIVEHLIQEGALFDHRNVAGWSLLFYLWFKPRRDTSAAALLSFLHDHQRCDFQSLHKNIYDSYGWSVMHHAAYNGTVEDILLLIQYGVDPYAVTKIKPEDQIDGQCYNFSVLQLVVLYGLLEPFKVLLPYYKKKYGNVDQPNDKGWTLLHMALDQEHLEIARILIIEGANVSARTKRMDGKLPNDKRGQRCTPFSLAEEAGPDFYEQFCSIVDQEWRTRQAPPQIQTKDRVSVREETKTRHLCQGHTRKYDRTSLSGNSRGHFGDVNVQNTFHFRRLQLIQVSRTRTSAKKKFSMLQKR